MAGPPVVPVDQTHPRMASGTVVVGRHSIWKLLLQVCILIRRARRAVDERIGGRVPELDVRVPSALRVDGVLLRSPVLPRAATDAAGLRQHSRMQLPSGAAAAATAAAAKRTRRRKGREGKREKEEKERKEGEGEDGPFCVQQPVRWSKRRRGGSRHGGLLVCPAPVCRLRRTHCCDTSRPCSLSCI